MIPLSSLSGRAAFFERLNADPTLKDSSSSVRCPGGWQCTSGKAKQVRGQLAADLHKIKRPEVFRCYTKGSMSN